MAGSQHSSEKQTEMPRISDRIDSGKEDFELSFLV